LPFTKYSSSSSVDLSKLLSIPNYSIQGLDIISGKTSGLLPSITSWLKSSNIYGIEMTVQIRGYYDMKYMGDAPDATAFFSCRARDKTMVPLPSSVCHK